MPRRPEHVGERMEGRRVARGRGALRHIARQEGILLLLCVGSDLLPWTLSSFLDSHGSIWKAVFDNLSHAGIAAASWAVVLSLSSSSSSSSSPRSPEGFLVAAGSPLYRCLSYVLLRVLGRERLDRRNRQREEKTAAPSAAAGVYFDTEEAVSTSPPPQRAREAGTAGRAAAAREIFFAACVGSALDLDHFFAAGSLQLSKATELAARPWGHSVAALIVAAIAVSVLTYSRRAAASVFLAGASHQLRDAIRRGLWLYPPRGPKTPRLGYPMYLLAQALLPLVVGHCLTWEVAARCCRCRKGMRRRSRVVYDGDAWRENEDEHKAIVLAL